LYNYHINEITHLSKYIFTDVPDIVPIIFILTREKISDLIKVNILKNGLKQVELTNNNYEIINYIDPENWKAQKDSAFNIYLNSSINFLLSKIRKNTYQVAEKFEVSYGIKKGNNEKYLSSAPNGDNFVPCLEKGAEIQRYNLEWFGKYIDYGSHLPGYKRQSLSVPKIIIQYTRKLSMKRRIVAGFDIEGKFYPLNRFSYITSSSKLDLDELLYLMAILNSTTLNFFHANTFIDYDIKPTYLKKLPIRRISFTTPAPERAQMVTKLQQLYAEGNRAEILARVDACLPKDAAGNFIADQEKSDVMHDLLAFLAERMLEMNKQKQQEIKGFLSWLEGFVGARVEDLTPKTKLQSYYEHDYESFLAVLKKNRKKLAVDPARREPGEALRAEFEGSVGKLGPLRERIRQTDELIDAVVYRLYGLTEEEIAIVEGREITKSHCLQQ